MSDYVKNVLPVCYNMCHVMLYNMCHVMLYNMCHAVMLKMYVYNML